MGNPIHGAYIKIYDATTGSTETLIGGQRDVTINIKSDTVEMQTKSDYVAATNTTGTVTGGAGKKYKYSWYSWDVSFSGVYDDATTANYFAAKLIMGTTVKCKIYDSSTGSGSGTLLYEGDALVTEWSNEASNDDIATFSCSLQGTGGLKVANGGS